MKYTDSDYQGILEFLRSVDLAYVFKMKRLRYMKMATVNNEMSILKGSFFDLWEPASGGYRLKNPDISAKSIEIVLNLFGKHEEAEAFLDSNIQLAGLDPDNFHNFLSEGISSKRAIHNLFNIFFGTEGPSIIGLVKQQIPYIKRYIPTLAAVDKTAPGSVILSGGDRDNIWHFIDRFDEIYENLLSDTNLYRNFMKDFKQLFRKKGFLKIIGYGEISTVMKATGGQKLDAGLMPIDIDDSGWIWKKMPPFQSIEAVKTFEKLYIQYREILTGDIGLLVPKQLLRYFTHSNFYIVYAGQEKADSTLICNLLIKKLDEKNALLLFQLILKRLGKVYSYNIEDHDLSIGFDAQLSNWVLVPKVKDGRTVSKGDDLIYIDTSSPLIKVKGIEQLDTEVFIKSAASFLRPVIRKFFLDEVVNRYYDIRSVVIDIIANLYKEKREDLIDCYIDTANKFFVSNDISVDALTRKEIDKYYSGDAFIWRFYQASRRIDRFLTEKILRRKYIYRLPGRVER